MNDFHTPYLVGYDDMVADLSFNHIDKIEGLSKLTRLLDLSLYNNKLTILEGLDALEDLAALSVGNNLIKDLDKVQIHSYLKYNKT